MINDVTEGRKDCVNLQYRGALLLYTTNNKINLFIGRTVIEGLYRTNYIITINNYKEKKFCPIETVKEWIEKKKKEEKLLFPYSDKLIALIVKKSIESIGLQPSLYSGHSLRSGFATSTASAGADERSIMQMTGHKSAEMVTRYIKDANLFKNNALNKL